MMPGKSSYAGALARAALFLVAAIAVAIGAYVAISTARMVFQTATVLPISDQWDELVAGRHITLQWLVSQRNVHRILVPRLLFIADEWLAGGTNRFNYAAMLAMSGAMAVLATILATIRRREPVYIAWSAGLSFTFAFWATQSESFLWASTIQFFCVLLASFSVFSLISLKVPNYRLVILIIFLETLAVYSSGNGLFAPAIALILAWRISWPRVFLIALAIAAVALPAIYLVGFDLPSSAESGSLGLQIGEILRYFLTELGAPFGVAARNNLGWDQLTVSFAVGAAGFAIFAYLGFRLFSDQDRDRAQLALFAFAVFVCATVANITLYHHRLHTGLEYWEYAVTGRFTTFTVWFWASLALIVFRRAATARRAGIFVTAFTPVLVIVLVSQMSITGIGYYWQVWESRQAAAPALLAGVNDRPLLSNVYYGPDAPIAKRDILKAARSSVFADAWSAWLGTRLADRISISAPDQCRGEFGSALAVDDPEKPGWRGIGWAWDAKRKVPAERLIFTNAAGIVVGYGSGGFGFASPFERAGWLGEINDRTLTGITAFALVDGDRTACPLGSPRRSWVDPIYWNIDRLSEPVPGTAVAISGQWCRDGRGSGPAFPLPGNSYGSYCVGGDGGTGKISFTNLPDATAPIGLPILLGPRVGGLSVSVIDRRSGTVVSSLLLQTLFAGFERWYTLVIPPPPGGNLSQLAIEARDDGKGWGEWFAVAQPYFLKSTGNQSPNSKPSE